MGRRLAVLAIMVAVAFALAGCFGTGIGGGNGSPIAAFTYTQDGFQFSFDASASADPGGSIVIYNWYFGDGATGSGVRTSHRYTRAGTYSVRLLIQDDQGARDEITLTVSIVQPEYPPTAAFIWTQGKAVGETVSFNGKRSSDRDGEIVSGRWTFGDGRSTSGTWVRYSDGERFSVKREVTHVYRRAGNYTVTLTVTDDTGKTDSTSHTIVIREP